MVNGHIPCLLTHTQKVVNVVSHVAQLWAVAITAANDFSSVASPKFWEGPNILTLKQTTVPGLEHGLEAQNCKIC